MFAHNLHLIPCSFPCFLPCHVPMDRHGWQFKKYEHHMRQRNGMRTFLVLLDPRHSHPEGAGCEV